MFGNKKSTDKFLKTNQHPNITSFVHALVENGLVNRQSYWNNELVNINSPTTTYHLPAAPPCPIMAESTEGSGDKLLLQHNIALDYSKTYLNYYSCISCLPQIE